MVSSDRKLTPEQLRLVVLATILVIVGGIAVSRMIRNSGMGEAGGQAAGAEYESRDLPKLAQVSAWEDEGVDAITSRNPFTFGAPPTPTRNLTPPPTRPPLPTRPPRPTPTPRVYLDPYGNNLGPPPPFGSTSATSVRATSRSRLFAAPGRSRVSSWLTWVSKARFWKTFLLFVRLAMNRC